MAEEVVNCFIVSRPQIEIKYLIDGFNLISKRRSVVCSLIWVPQIISSNPGKAKLSNKTFLYYSSTGEVIWASIAGQGSCGCKYLQLSSCSNERKLFHYFRECTFYIRFILKLKCSMKFWLTLYNWWCSLYIRFILKCSIKFWVTLFVYIKTRASANITLTLQ